MAAIRSGSSHAGAASAVRDPPAGGSAPRAIAIETAAAAIAAARPISTRPASVPSAAAAHQPTARLARHPLRTAERP